MSENDDTRTPPGGDPLGNGDIHGTPDATLGGYVREHSRPPAFEGVDGEPYTVSIEIEKTGNLHAPFEGYLVFPRWASTGVGVIGHVETATLLTGRSREQLEARLGDLSLVHVKVLLDRAIERAGEGAVGEGNGEGDGNTDAQPGSGTGDEHPESGGER